MLRYVDIAPLIAALWGAPDVPVLTLDGSDCRLVDQAGRSVSFSLKRAQLALSPEQFATQVLAPEIEKLRGA